MLLQSVTSSEEWDDVLLLHMVSSSVVLPRHLHHLSHCQSSAYSFVGWLLQRRVLMGQYSQPLTGLGGWQKGDAVVVAAVDVSPVFVSLVLDYISSKCIQASRHSQSVLPTKHTESSHVIQFRFYLKSDYPVFLHCYSAVSSLFFTSLRKVDGH